VPKRRDQIRMSGDEMWRFIESQKTVQLATLGPDGWPHVVPLWFAIDDAAIALETFTKSQKVKNLQRDPRVTLLLEDGLVYEELRGVMIRSRAELHQDFETVHRLHVAMLSRNQPELGAEAIDAVSRQLAPKKTAIVVRPERLVTWDHSKLGGIY